MSKSRGSQMYSVAGPILAILVAIAVVALEVPALIPRPSSGSRHAAAKADLATISSALQTFRLDCNRYPTTAEGLGALTQPPPSLTRVWRGPYLTRPIAEEPNGRSYRYIGPTDSHPDRYTVTETDGDGHTLVETSN